MAHVLDAVIRLKDNFTDTIQRVEKSVEDFSRTYKRMGSDIQRTGKTISGIGKTLTATVTMPLIGLGTAAIKLGMDFEAGMSQVQALTGATAQEMKQLSDMAKHLGETTIFSAKEAAEGMAFLGMAGFEVSEIMDSMPGLLDLAAASNMELGRAADIATNILSGFGMKAAEAGRVADVLAKGASSANTSVEQLGGAMKYVAPVAASLGLKIEDLTAAVGFMSDAGIQGEQAGRQLRQGLLRLANPTGEAAKLIDKLGIEAFNADGSMKTLDKVVSELEKSLGKMDDKTRSAALATLFGAESVAGWTALIQRGSEELAAYTKELENAEGAAKEMADIMQDNLQGQLTMLKSQLEGVALELAEVLIPIVSQGVSKISEFIDRIRNMDDGTKETIKGVLKFAVTIGPLLLIIGKMTSGIGKVVEAYGKFGIAVKKVGLKAAIFTPGVKVALVLAAIAAGAVLVYKNWDKIKPVIDTVKETIGDFIETNADRIEWLKEVFTRLGTTIMDSVRNIWETLEPLKDKFFEIIGKIGELLGRIMPFLAPIIAFITGIFIGKIIHGFLTMFHQVEAVIEGIIGVIEGLLTFLGGLIDFIIGVFTGDWGRAWEGIQTMFTGVVDIITSAWRAFVDFVTAPVEALVDILDSAFHEKAESVKRVWGEIKEFLKHPIKGTVNLVRKGAGWIGGKLGIGQNYKGTMSWRGGPTWVHERGGEIIDLPRGTRIYPHDKSVQMAREQGRKESQTQTIVQRLIPVEIPNIKDQVQKVVQELKTVSIPNIKDQTQTIKQRLIPVKVPNIDNQTQTISQKLNQINIPNIKDQTQTIIQKLIPANIKEPIPLEQPIKREIIPIRNNNAKEREQKTSGNNKTEIKIPKLADQIIVREESDIDKIAQAIVREIEKASLNMA